MHSQSDNGISCLNLLRRDLWALGKSQTFPSCWSTRTKRQHNDNGGRKSGTARQMSTSASLQRNVMDFRMHVAAIPGPFSQCVSWVFHSLLYTSLVTTSLSSVNEFPKVLLPMFEERASPKASFPPLKVAFLFYHLLPYIRRFILSSFHAVFILYNINVYILTCFNLFKPKRSQKWSQTSLTKVSD